MPRNDHEACAFEADLLPGFPSNERSRCRNPTAPQLEEADRLASAFGILRRQSEAIRRKPSYRLDPSLPQLAVMLEDSPALRALTEGVETVIQRRGILHHARMGAFAKAADRSVEMPAAARALLLIAARSERDLYDVVLVVVSMMRGRRGLSSDFDAHIDQVLSRLSSSLGHVHGERRYYSMPWRTSAPPPPIDLSIAAGRIASVVTPPEWAYGGG